MYSFVGIRVCLGWFPSLGQISETFGLGGLGGRSPPRRTSDVAAAPGRARLDDVYLPYPAPQVGASTMIFCTSYFCQKSSGELLEWL